RRAPTCSTICHANSAPRSRRRASCRAASSKPRMPRKARARSPRSGRPCGSRGSAVAMAIDPRSPCIIGVAAHTWHPEDVGDRGAPEPLDMWETVARVAAADAGSPHLLEQLDSLQVVYCQTWQYDDAVARLADRLGAEPKHRQDTRTGGSQRVWRVEDAYVGKRGTTVSAKGACMVDE